jgi:hypothetical protein
VTTIDLRTTTSANTPAKPAQKAAAGTGRAFPAARPAGLLGRIYEAVTGRPYWTVGGCASTDYGPTPGAEIADVFGDVGDAALMFSGDWHLSRAREIRAARARREVTR